MKTLKPMIAVLLFAVFCGQDALAAGPAPSRVVRYSLTDLATPSGVARLHLQLSAAAREVCQQYARQRRLFQRCSGEALSAGVGQIQNEALTAYHQRKHGALVVAAAGPGPAPRSLALAN
jgi:UrcA family protein